MPQSVVRGQPITLEATYTDVNGDLAAPTLPTVSIVNPSGVTVVSNVVPTLVSLGRYEYGFGVPASAPLGAWAAEWTGTVNGSPVDASEGFTVLAAAPTAPNPDGSPGEGPCADWIAWADVENACTPATLPGAAAAQAILRAQILAAATRTLWKRSCEQFGLCTIARARVRPTCGHTVTCRCGSYPFLDLGVAPVVSVVAVWVDGVELAASAYRVDDWRRLVRVDGENWSSGSNLQADEGDDGTFEVSWTYGIPVPDDAKLMAALLACKMAKDVAEACGVLPANTTSVAAEGITIQINPPEGDTGVPIVEQWLSNFHCGGGRIFDPGAHAATMRVGT